MQLRRVNPRQPTNWIGTYRIDGSTYDRHGQCRVLDVSTAGAALELFEAIPGEALGHQIVVSVELRGDVRHSSPAKNDRLRVGLEFEDVSAIAGRLVSSMRELGTPW